jgi:hypothetical protein
MITKKNLLKMIERENIKYRTPICGSPLLMPYQVYNIIKKLKK